MSEQSPYDNISISEDGRFVRYEWDVNYITDEQLETLRKHVETLQAENAKLRDALDFCLKYVPKCDECEAMLDCDECLRADTSHKERKRLDYENAELRELVEDMAAEMRGLGVDFKRVGWCDYADRMHELGVEMQE